MSGSFDGFKRDFLSSCKSFETIPIGYLEGRIASLAGLSFSIEGLNSFSAVGDRVRVIRIDRSEVFAEIIAFRDEKAVAMSYGSIEGIGIGCRVILPLSHLRGEGRDIGSSLRVNDSWRGRIVDPMGIPVDMKGALLSEGKAQKVKASPPDAANRIRLGERIDLGVSVLNLFATCCCGQRLGLFAGSGVGKSTLISMLARNTACDVAVIALVGERGREVREFIEDDLGEEGLKKSIVVVATSDSPPLMRREAAYTAMTIAESFRDQGKSVLLLMDSVTRFCQALREIGLSSGELPATRGYPPSVFAELPRLLERAGPGTKDKGGQITAFFSVLVDGDDHNEPISDAVRGILDGHIVMDRKIAEKGRYPAVNILKTLSRTVSKCNSREENNLILKARSYLSLADSMIDMVRLGAYQEGNDLEVDRALKITPKLEELVTQRSESSVSIEDAFKALAEIIGD